MTYHLAIDGVQKDPVSEEALRNLIGEGTVGAAALCWREGWTDWKPVAQAFPELFAAGVAAPVPVALPASVGPAPATDYEAIRNAHLKHEASLQGIGSLYLLGSVLLTFVAVVAVSNQFHEPYKSPSGPGVAVFTAVLFLGLALLQLRVGLWLRKLSPKARTPATVLAAIGLLGFPVGTLINVYVLYLLRSKKGELILSAPYQDVIAATPHIKYKTPLLVWILLGLLVALLLLGLSATLFSNHRA